MDNLRAVKAAFVESEGDLSAIKTANGYWQQAAAVLARRRTRSAAFKTGIERAIYRYGMLVISAPR